MNEVKALSLLVVALLLGSYWSWTKEEPKKATTDDDKVTVVPGKPDELLSVTLVTKTQTVTLSRKELGADKYLWFDVLTKTKNRGFVANEKTDKLIEGLAPLMGIRSLGKGLSETQLEEIKLKNPQMRLKLGQKSGERTFDLGGRTYGSRDYYLRSKGGSEIFLVGSKVLSNLEYPEGEYMQRKLRVGEMTEVASLTVTAGKAEKRFLHKSRLSTEQAFWTSANAPEEKSETVGNYVNKLEELSIRAYPETPPKDLTKVLEATWSSEDKPLGTVTLYRAEDEKKKLTYFAQSSVTKLLGEVSTATGEQLERTLADLLAE